MDDQYNRPGERPPTAGPARRPAAAVDEPPRIIEVDEPGHDESRSQRLAQEGRKVAEDARHEAGALAASAKQGAAEVVDDAKHHATELMEQARRELEEQANDRTDQMGRTLTDLGQQLHALAEGRSEEAGEVPRYVDQIGDQLERIGDRVTELGFDGAVAEVQRFARRRPGMFLLGAAAAGFAFARIGRGARDAGDERSSAGDDRSNTAAGRSTARPRPAGTGVGPAGAPRAVTPPVPTPQPPIGGAPPFPGHEAPGGRS